LNTQALDALVRNLETEFRGPVRPARMSELLGEYARARTDWREFALFSSEHYTRNLVARAPRFELMILCWGPGQESPIHNHEGQDCWMAVLDGELEEVRYPMPAGDRAGPLTSTGTLRFGSGQVAFIRDEMGLHLVRPRGPSSGVSLHLYSEPYDECNCYCPDTGRVTRKRLRHHSARGEILAAEGPA
jgi:cysteine dioxygenase